MAVHAAETTMQISRFKSVPDRQAYTEEPYRNMLRSELLPIIAAAPIIGMPVPMKNEAATEIPK